MISPAITINARIAHGCQNSADCLASSSSSSVAGRSKGSVSRNSFPDCNRRKSRSPAEIRSVAIAALPIRNCRTHRAGLLMITLPLVHYSVICYPIAGRRICQSVSRSNMRAARSRRSSSNAGPSNCSPTGKPDGLIPHGTEIAGIPARFAETV